MQSAAGVCAGLLGGLRELFEQRPEALVCVGPPGEYLPDLIVAITDWRVPEIARPTMGTARSREDRLEIDVIFSAFMAGDLDVQVATNSLAWEAAEEFASWLRTRPNETLGDSCRDSYVSAKSLTPEIAYQIQDGMTGGVPVGRTAAVTVTVTAYIRY